MVEPGFWHRLNCWIRYDVIGLKDPLQGGEASDPTPAVMARARHAVAQRRAILTAIGRERSEDEVPSASMGLALSGGGIRSATLSLGVAQALAQHDRLLDFDYCSTVSGGGYFGSFLGSLFLPQSARGPAAQSGDASPDEARDKAAFAHRALTAAVRETVLHYDGAQQPVQVRNPLWWLREHSRYLAPNGSSDYLSAAAYMARNWLAMIYVFMLPVALVSLFLIVATYALLYGHVPIIGTSVPGMFGDLLFLPSKSGAGWFISSFMLLAALFLFVTIAAGLAYWLTEYMSLGASSLRHRMEGVKGRFNASFIRSIFSSRYRLGRSLIASLLGTAVAAYLGCGLLPGVVQSTDAVPSGSGSLLGIVIVIGLALVATSVLIGGGTFILARGLAGDAFTAEVRRQLTQVNALCLAAILICLAGAIVDTLALHLYAQLVADKRGDLTALWSGISGLLLPASAWIINKLPGWVGDGDGRIARFVGGHIWTIALFVGLALFGLLGIVAHLAMQYLLFDGMAWLHPSPPDLDNKRILFVGGVVLTLFLLTGWSTGFINLSSLHNIYASRLTRAYLGATNLERLAKSADTRRKTSIKDSDPLDQIPVDVYQQSRSAAPIHLINVTLNETKSQEKSQLLERDRKGVPIVFAPEGIFVDAGRDMTAQQYYSWTEMSDLGVESLSVGQLCAISGAAASSAMGARTTLGGALTLTFANIRLGYWWAVGDMIRGRVTLTSKPGTWLYYRCTRPLRTYFYLWNEMWARYSRTYGRLNISDGGHFENSGAYELLRRGVRTVVVCDNGADPDYSFDDLEVLVRKARIDLGLSLNVADAAHVERTVGKRGALLFLNGTEEEWRERIDRRDPNARGPSVEDRAYCLLLNVYDDRDGDGRVRHCGHIVWMKPRLFCGVPQDVVGYALNHRDFPHETTGDQFFDEAQWESHRALGTVMMNTLLTATFHGKDLFRQINRSL